MANLASWLNLNENGASHQKWKSWHLAQIWWLARMTE
jgi:hypothetical protein